MCVCGKEGRYERAFAGGKRDGAYEGKILGRLPIEGKPCAVT